jgi:hypothetical protein
MTKSARADGINQHSHAFSINNASDSPRIASNGAALPILQS